MSTEENMSEIISIEEAGGEQSNVTSSRRRPKGTGKKKIEIKGIDKEEQRMVTFSKRRKGLFQKAEKFHSLMGFVFAIVVFSPTGRAYLHGKPSFHIVFRNYLQYVTENGDGRWIADFLSWLRAIRLEEFRNAEELLMLKTKSHELLEKLRKKLGHSSAQELAS